MIIEDALAGVKRKKFLEENIRCFFSLVKSEHKKTLDVGCGKGAMDYLGAKEGKFKDISACDVFDDFQIDEIKQFGGAVEYRHIENGIIPFDDNIFDLVFSIDVMEHVKDDVALILEKIRVARSGGLIVIDTPNYFRIGNLVPYLMGKLNYPRIMGHDSYGEIIHLREYKKSELESILNKIKHLIDPGSVRIKGCFLGVPCLNLEIRKFPSVLENFCHIWLVSFNKK